MTFFPRRIVSTIDSVNSAFRSCLVLSSWKFVQLGICLLEFCLFWESGHMTFCPCRVVSIISSLNSRFCSRLAYSTWDSIYLGVGLLGVCPLESLATWHSAHVGVCPLMVLSTLDSAHIWFCLLGIMFMKEYFYLRSCTLGILFTWVFDYLDSVHLGVCPHDSRSTKLSAWDKVFQISSGSPLVLSLFESVQLGVYLPGFCTLWSLATWHSFQVGLCPLLVLSTLDCAHFWFCLLGSQSTWVVVYLESVHLGVWPHDILAM